MFQLPTLIPVHFCESKGPWKTVNSPNDLQALTSVQYATRTDVVKLLEQIPRGQRAMKSLSPQKRAEILRTVASLIQEHASRLAYTIAAEGGKPLVDAKVEVARAQNTIELCAEECLASHSESIPMDRTKAGAGHKAHTSRDPIGPVLAISAFNHPLNLLAHQVGCAIASGCSVVVKPAPATPISAFELQQFFQTAGLPKECLMVVNADIPEIEFITQSPLFGYVNFIGSAKVGWNLRRMIAPGTRIGLEHGGQAPAIVAHDAILANAVSALLKGAFYHAGQVCISTQRIFVNTAVAQEFTDLFRAGAAKLNVGDAREEATEVGPLIRKDEVARLQQWIREAVDAGAKVITGNEVRGQGQYLTPTVLIDVPRKCKLMTEEAFGPVVCINTYSSMDELLEYLNQNPYIFESCIFSQDSDLCARFAREMSSMCVVINNHNAYRVDWMPFGGHGLSGLGMGGVKYLIQEMSRLKLIIEKS